MYRAWWWKRKISTSKWSNLSWSHLGERKETRPEQHLSNCGELPTAHIKRRNYICSSIATNGQQTTRCRSPYNNNYRCRAYPSLNCWERSKPATEFGQKSKSKEQQRTLIAGTVWSSTRAVSSKTYSTLLAKHTFFLRSWSNFYSNICIKHDYGSKPKIARVSQQRRVNRNINPKHTYHIALQLWFATRWR
jgi:hypothetical protein